MNIPWRRPPTERETAERKLARSGIPEFRSPSPGYQGRGANYTVRGEGLTCAGVTFPGRDRTGVGYVIPPGGRTLQQDRAEEEQRVMRADWERDPGDHGVTRPRERARRAGRGRTP